MKGGLLLSQRHSSRNKWRLRWLAGFFYWQGRRLPHAEADEYEEKRRFVRVPSRNLIRITHTDEIAQDILLNLVNLSEGGFRLPLPRFGHWPGILKASLNLKEFNCQIPVLFKIVWAQKIPDRGRETIAYMGVQNLEMSPGHLTLLRGLIAQKLARRRAC